VRPVALGLVAAGALLGAGCGDDEESKPAAETKPATQSAASGEAKDALTVDIASFKYLPKDAVVAKGATVSFVNKDKAPHTATAEDGSFDTGTLRKGESGSATFTSAGTINYICSPHPYMKGQVVVQAANAGSGDGTGPDGGTDDTTSTDTDDSGGAVAGDDSTSSGTSGLADTGGEALSIALLGIATLGLGLLLRRRRET
jgi:LPXTG-motif cell wall-anchored protein